MSRLNQLLTIVRSLPPTPLRPANSAQLSDGLEAIITRAFPIASSTSPSPPPASPSFTTANPISTLTNGDTRTLGPSEERAAEEMRSAIERIKSNFALQRFPLSDRTMRPPSDPLYYKRIMDGVHRSQKGQGRSWWKLFFQVKGEA